MVEKQGGLKTFQNYFYMVLLGQSIEELNQNSNKANKEKLQNLTDILTSLIEFVSLRPNNIELQDSFSPSIKTKINLIYIHTGVGSMGKGGLRLISKAIAKVPKSIQGEIVDEIHVLDSKTRLNWRIGRAKIVSKLSDMGLFGNSINGLSTSLFQKIQVHQNLHEFIQFWFYRCLNVETANSNGEKAYINL